MTESRIERRTLKAGARLFLEGDAPDNAYVIDSGRVEISKKVDNDEVVINSIGRGDMVGEMALIDDAPRIATARATEETVVLVIPRADFEERLKRADPVLRRTFVILTKRLRDLIKKTASMTTIIR